MNEEALVNRVLERPELWEEVRQLQAIKEDLLRQVSAVDEATAYVLKEIGFG